MSQPQTGIRDHTSRDRKIFLVVSAYLVATFLWRFLAVAHEGQLQTDQYLTIALDVLAIAGLIGLNTRLSKGKPLFWIALAAGVGLLAMRFLNGETGWWSGHLAFELCPRVGEEIVCSCRNQISITALCP